MNCVIVQKLPGSLVSISVYLSKHYKALYIDFHLFQKGLYSAVLPGHIFAFNKRRYTDHKAKRSECDWFFACGRLFMCLISKREPNEAT